MAQRPTPRPFRGECPFCNARLVSEASSCSSCTRIFNAEDISIIREIIDLDPRLRDLENAHELTAKVQQQKSLAAEEAQRVELELTKIRKEDEEKRVAALAEARANEIAKLESMPRWKRMLLSRTGKIIGSSFLGALLLSLLVFTNSQKPSADLRTDATPTQSAGATALESPTTISEAEIKVLEDRALNEMDSVQKVFCVEVQAIGINRLKSLDAGSSESESLSEIYEPISDLESQFGSQTGRLLKNDLGNYWLDLSRFFSYGDVTFPGSEDRYLESAIALHDYCVSNFS